MAASDSRECRRGYCRRDHPGVDGPLATVRGGPPEDSAYDGPASALSRVWIDARRNVRNVVEHVALADIASGKLPARIVKLAKTIA